MIARQFTRSGGDLHVPTLADAIRGLIAGSFYVTPGPGSVTIEAASWDDVDTQAVQTAVTAAAADTETVRAQYDVDSMPPLIKGAFLVLLDEINRLRQNPSTVYPVATPAHFLAAVKAKIGAL